MAVRVSAPSGRGGISAFRLTGIPPRSRKTPKILYCCGLSVLSALSSRLKLLHNVGMAISFGTKNRYMVDRRRDALYDRVRLAAGSMVPEVITLFGVPVGGLDQFTGKVKSFADTNMFYANQLMPPDDMLVRRFVLLFQPRGSETDRDQFLNRFAWSFWVHEKTLQREPVLTIAMEGKPEDLIKEFGKSAERDVNGGVLRNLGIGQAWDLLEFAKDGDTRVYIPPLMYFTVKLEGEGFKLDSDLDFYVMLDGLRDYPIQ